MRKITTTDFKKEIYDYDNNNIFKLQSNKPTIVMFSGDWCGPCKIVTPILDELGEEYKEQINIVKVDTDAEKEVVSAFGIRSLPTMLYMPLEGEYITTIGVQNKNQYKKLIEKLIE